MIEPKTSNKTQQRHLQSCLRQRIFLL